MATEWIIRGQALQTPARQAGGWALKGFDFQAAYASLKVVELLGCVDGLMAVRYEGAQDVDLLYGDGRQVHVQIKNRPSETLNWAALEPVLLGFLKDWTDADAKDRPFMSFKLITVSMPEGDDVTRFARGVFLGSTAKKLVAAAGKPLRDAHGAKLKDLAVAMLGVTRIEFVARTYEDHLRLATRGRLAPFLSEPADAALAISDILAALEAGGVITARGALELVRKYALKPNHPFRGGSPFKAVGVGLTRPSASTVTSFRNGALVSWEALDEALDITRDVTRDVKDKLAAATSAEFHLLRGPGGSGKTTIARRAAYDLARAGEMLAFDLVDQDPEAADWDRLFAFAKAMDRRVLLLVDDPKDRTPALDYLLGLETDPPLVILSTTRPDIDVNAMLHDARVPVCDTDLGAITNGEVERLAHALGKTPPAGAERASLQASGQIFLLAMVMAEGSVEQFAAKLLAPLKISAPDMLAAYIDLCLCARLDQRIPESVLLKRRPSAINLDQNPHFFGLVTRLGVKQDALRAGHALLADAVVKVEGGNPVARALALLDNANAGKETERRFGIRLAQSVIALDPGPAAASADALAKHLLRFAAPGEYADLHRIAGALRRLNETEALSQVEAQAARTPIQTGVDASIKMGDARGTALFGALFDELLDFYARDETRYGRRNFIARCTIDATAAQATAMLKVMFPWLARRGYPALEAKSLLDVLSSRSDLDTGAFKSEMAALLDGMPSSERLLYPAVATVDVRLNDPDLDLKLAIYADRTLSADALVAFPSVATIYSRHLFSRGEPDARRGLAQLLIQAASDPRLNTNGVKRRTLLVAALTVAMPEDLEPLRKTALGLSIAEPAKDEARMTLTFMRAPEAASPSE